MTLKETCETIMDKVNDVGSQESKLSSKISMYKLDKEQAEADKIKALESKDETAYKNACRALADAEAGIEFNSICLRDVQHKKHATESESMEIKRNLNICLKEIYLDAMEEIESALLTIEKTAREALEKIEIINSMAQIWGESVMRDYHPGQGYFSGDKKVFLEQHLNIAKARIEIIQKQKGR